MSITVRPAKKVFLMDVVAIRLTLIVLLILYHAFCIYTGAWRVPYDGFLKIPAYDWLGSVFSLWRLEGMVLISGLLFGYNTMRRSETENFLRFTVKKAKRILLPCLFFGIIYYALFYDLNAPWGSIIYKIANGCGHLWFLPMIFWCYVISYGIIDKSPSTLKIYLVISGLFVVFNPLAMLPFGLGKIGAYYLYFLLGFCIKKGSIKLPDANNRNLMLAILLFCISYIIHVFVLREHWKTEEGNIYMKVLRTIVFNVVNLGAALSAIYFIYSVSNKPKIMNWLSDKTMLITLSGYCYGVYIFHQFILYWLYFKTAIPMSINVYALPWIAFAITLILSLLLCHLTLKAKFGKFLIG